MQVFSQLFFHYSPSFLHRQPHTLVGDKEVNYNSWATKVAAGTSLSEFAKSHLNNHPKLVIYIDANGKVTDQSNSSI